MIVKNLRTISKILLVVLSTIGCTTPECVDMPMLASFGAADGEAYQAKVRELLEDHQPEDFRYFFESFMDEGSQSFMMTSFRNEKICLQAKVLVDKWDKLGGMKARNGKAYPKELVNLKWKIGVVEERPQIIYQEMRRIID